MWTVKIIFTVLYFLSWPESLLPSDFQCLFLTNTLPRGNCWVLPTVRSIFINSRVTIQVSQHVQREGCVHISNWRGVLQGYGELSHLRREFRPTAAYDRLSVLLPCIFCPFSFMTHCSSVKFLVSLPSGYTCQVRLNNSLLSLTDTSRYPADIPCPQPHSLVF